MKMKIRFRIVAPPNETPSSALDNYDGTVTFPNPGQDPDSCAVKNPAVR